MMQSCASAAKLRGDGPILNRGSKAIVLYRVAATSVRHLQLGINMTPGCRNSVVLGNSFRRRPKEQTRRHVTGRYEPPQRNQELAR
jgi:hypothetical protein